jgi:hypothetical protein
VRGGVRPESRRPGLPAAGALRRPLGEGAARTEATRRRGTRSGVERPGEAPSQGLCLTPGLPAAVALRRPLERVEGLGQERLGYERP